VTGSWEGYGEIIAASVIRGAAATIGQMALSSSSFRGKDVLGIKSSKASGTSTVWVEQLSPYQWNVALGLATQSYQRALDWQLTFAVSQDAAGYKVDVVTPAVATKDGTQVHKREYLEFRDLVLTGLGLGQVPNPATELGISQKSLRMTQPPLTGLREGAGKARRTIETALSPDEVAGRIELLPYRVLERTATVRRLRLGADDDAFEQSATIEINDAGATRLLIVSYDIELCGDEPTDVMCVRHATMLAGYVLAVLQGVDPSVKETTDTGSEGSP
jgi:hypothetical protein